MSVSKTIGIRVSDTFLQEFQQMAHDLSVFEGKPVRTTDLFWRLLDRGMEVLERELMEQNNQDVPILKHSIFSLEASRRAQKLLAFHLKSVQL